LNQGRGEIATEEIELLLGKRRDCLKERKRMLAHRRGERRTQEYTCERRGILSRGERGEDLWQRGEGNESFE